MKLAYKFIIILLETIIAYVVTKIFDISLKIPINVGAVFGIIVIIISICLFVINYISKSRKILKEKDMAFKEQEEKIAKMNKLNLEMKNNEGDRLLLMSLSQNLYEPLKLSLLKKSAFENNNVLSAIMLANFYISGVEHEGKYIILPNLEEATMIYMRICKYDNYGISDWELGWIYENQLIKDTKKQSKDECLKIAREYYEKSADKGYAKAYNSLGKFYYYGYGELKKSFTKAIEYYTKAANYGDVYAIMNCGLICMNKYYDTNNKHYLEEAETHFKKAKSYNNAEGLLQLGIIYEIQITDDMTYLNKAKKHYIKAFSEVKNQYSATAYYKLGKLINNNPTLKSDNDIISALGSRRFDSLPIECFTRAYEIFQELDVKERRLEGKYRECFDELVGIFNDII